MLGCTHSQPVKLQVDSLAAESQGKTKNTGVVSLSLLQRIFLTQESNQGVLHCRWILYQLNYQKAENICSDRQSFSRPQEAKEALTHFGLDQSVTGARSESNTSAPGKQHCISYPLLLYHGDTKNGLKQRTFIILKFPWSDICSGSHGVTIMALRRTVSFLKDLRESLCLSFSTF